MKSLILIVFSMFFYYIFNVWKLLFEEKISNKVVSSILSLLLFMVYISFISYIAPNAYLLRIFVSIIAMIIIFT